MLIALLIITDKVSKFTNNPMWPDFDLIKRYFLNDLRNLNNILHDDGGENVLQKKTFKF